MKKISLPIIACLLGQPWSAALAQEGSVILPKHPDDTVQLSLQKPPVDRNHADLLQVYVGQADACCAGKTPIAGAYELDGNTLSFDPAFDFILGQDYTVQSADRLTGFVIGPETNPPIPQVVAIYPSGPTLPENTLRFYIQFSTPMMPHRAGEFIKLLDANGTADTAAFMSFTQELWNEDRTRLTLLMDPGRIKRGVAQNVALGPALLEGRPSSIVIEDGWPSALGGQNAPLFEQSFTVVPPLRSLPDVDLWRIQPPKLGTNTSLVIAFDRPFDHQQAQTAITVRDMEGQRISGTIMLQDHQRIWRFEPDAPWTTTQVQITVDPRLEDVAGNNFKDLLDHTLGTDMVEQDQKMITIGLTLEP